MTELEQSINEFWALCQDVLGDQFDFARLPDDLSGLIKMYAEKTVKKNDVKIVEAVIGDKNTQKENKEATELLKLFDASSNGYRSVTNVLIEYLKIQESLNKQAFELAVKAFAMVDGRPLAETVVTNDKRCPICNRFPQDTQVFALISGNPQTDSLYQTYQNRKGRTNMYVCQYCFTAGWVDLPTAKITSESRQVNKGREYLFIVTSVSEKQLKRLLDVLIHVYREDEEETAILGLDETDPLDAFLEENNMPARDSLSVLGMSGKRLRELRGFVLQSSNQLLRTLVVRVPIERLVGEDKVSGAVQRELTKAAMYDFWRIVGGSLHYGRIVEGVPFSIDGQEITEREMERASHAYYVADCHTRFFVKKTKQYRLNSALFMLLLTDPRLAANRILNTKRREDNGKYAPNKDTVKEIIMNIEKLADPNDWQFQLGLRVVETLINLRMVPKARGFWKPNGQQYSGVDLVKWIQRMKMIHDSTSARAWGTSLINGYRREHDAGANTEKVSQILALVEEIIETCAKHDAVTLTELARNIANMDYYLLFYYTHHLDQSEEN